MPLASRHCSRDSAPSRVEAALEGPRYNIRRGEPFVHGRQSSMALLVFRRPPLLPDGAGLSPCAEEYRLSRKGRKPSVSASTALRTAVDEVHNRAVCGVEAEKGQKLELVVESAHLVQGPVYFPPAGGASLIINTFSPRRMSPS